MTICSTFAGIAVVAAVLIAATNCADARSGSGLGHGMAKPASGIKPITTTRTERGTVRHKLKVSDPRDPEQIAKGLLK